MPSDTPSTEILHAWALAGDRRVSLLGRGNINDTWLVHAASRQPGPGHVLQRLNRRVFKQPLQVMQNLSRITHHLRTTAPHRPHLSLVTTPAGDDWHIDAVGEFWRMFDYFPGTFTLGADASEEQLFDAAFQFGDFLVTMQSLPGPPLHTTIEGFHDTTAYLSALNRAITRDSLRRARHCGNLISRLQDNQWLVAEARRIRANPALPQRIVHNDCKLDNVLFNTTAGTAVCVIDLDTVMPGFSPWDYGDLIRSGASTGKEDASTQDTGLDRGKLKALHTGYLSAASDILSEAELESLKVAPCIVAYELATRFLTDYLSGDIYFTVRDPEQNLRRAANQIALLECFRQTIHPS